jgi:general L-amino acid transport system permease protein
MADIGDHRPARTVDEASAVLGPEIDALGAIDERPAQAGQIEQMLIIFLAAGEPVSFVAPQLKGFNFQGGHQLYPEFAALLIGLSVYTGSYIAEIVRSGIQAVPKGQTEAAYALGLAPGKTLRLVVVPQALRIIIPPLTSQYLNLIKNSSLAVFIGYPDLVQIFAGTVLNQTGAAVQVMAITLSVYLVISIATSLAMNACNRHFAIVER